MSKQYEAARVAAVQAVREAASQESLFGAESPPTEKDVDSAIVRSLIPAITACSSKRKRFTLVDLEETLLAEWFGRAARKHFRQACVQLVVEKKAHIVDPGKKENRVVIGDNTLIELL